MRGPLLLITGGRDHTVPGAVVRSQSKKYRHSVAVTDLHDFPDRAHSLTMDSGWRAVAEDVLAWLQAQDLAPRRPSGPGALPAPRPAADAPTEPAETATTPLP
jgi:hypothetical protein